METEVHRLNGSRIEALWAQLDPRGEGSIDFEGLRSGLKRINHPLQNADSMIADIMKTLDMNKDGRIQRNEFLFFVRSAEQHLNTLFDSIDRDRSGKLNKSEIEIAFHNAGLSVSNSNLEDFFAKVDKNNDGVISFEEWCDFLLFMPVESPSLKHILNYCSSTVKVNVEGDTTISDDAIESVGMSQKFFRTFCSLFANRLGRPSLQNHPIIHISPDSGVSVADSSSSTADLSELKLDPSYGGQAEARIKSSSCPKAMLIDHLPHPGYFAAGAAAGIVSRTVTAPLDRLKVYLIANTSVARGALEAASSGAVIEVAKKSLHPFVVAVMELWKAGGIRSLFAGNGLNVVKIMPETAIKFGSYEGAKQMFAKMEGHDDPKRIAAHWQFLAGGLSGTISQFAAYPIDTLKFRMQCEIVQGGLRGNPLILSTAKKMWTEGLRTFYRGLPMGLVGMFPYAAIDLSTFEFLKKRMKEYKTRQPGSQGDGQLGSVATAMIGGFSGAFGASTVYPLNVLRTRLQSQGTVLHSRTYTGVVDVFRQTVKGEGVRGLFKGLTPNLMKVVPAVSITYVVYENSKRVLGLP